MASILADVRAGQKIRAIKRYRTETGAGLLDAKNAVERIAERNGLAAPPAAGGLNLRLVAILAIAAFVLVALAITARALSQAGSSMP